MATESKARVLGVNIDHVATLRQVRGVDYPDIAQAVLEAEKGGADFITAHLREDRRHIQDADVATIMETCSTWLNLEISLEEAMIEIACAAKPRTVCLVPEKREELTTEGGLEVAGQASRVAAAVKTLQEEHVGLSLFIDPDFEQIKAAKQSGAEAIELHTGTYANASGSEAQKELVKLAEATAFGIEQGLIVNMGHGLTVGNAGPVASIEGVCEYNIGHSIVAQAVFVGLAPAVAQMRKALLL